MEKRIPQAILLPRTEDSFPWGAADRQLVPTYLEKYGNSYGYASACAYVITIMIVVISIFVNKFSEEKETGRRKYGK